MLSNIPPCCNRTLECSQSTPIIDHCEQMKFNGLIQHFEKKLLNWASATTSDAYLAGQESISIPIIPNIDSSVYNEWKNTFESKNYVVTQTNGVFKVSLS